MEKEEVFSSGIVRTENGHKNNLYDLLNIIPAKPLDLTDGKKYTCNFSPRTDKIYIPKRRSKVKVRTVRDIRTAFENDTYAYLPADLESQQNYLLKRIRTGSARKENTINIAKKMLRSDMPISRSTWQILVNLNPDGHIYPRQCVVNNGKYIQVNGSIGGKKKLICKYDLSNKKISSQVKKICLKTNILKKNKGLLRNSLSIKFKPGPLRRKKFLDDSNQKYNGDIDLVDLPKIGLVVQPTYGTFLDPSITQFVRNLCRDDGIISEKWAEFAVSVLGKIESSNARLRYSDCVTFDLNYKYDQHRILVRKDLDNSYIKANVTNTSTIHRSGTNDQLNILPEIEAMMSKILDTVEISINQDSFFAIDEDFKQIKKEDSNMMEITALSKDKTKKKYSELDRLDVTVISFPENSEEKLTHVCKNKYCSLGCVCESLNSEYKYRQHCGREECMFYCKCDFSKYTSITANADGSDPTHVIPEIIKIEDEINMKLSKEEQKFHQTVIVTGKKNILFKSEKRNWKSSKKYESFYKNMCLKNLNHRKRVLSIPLLKLDCEGIEPWCLVHNLYKCFCRCKFIETTASHYSEKLAKEPIIKDESAEIECTSEKTQIPTSDTPFKTERPRRQERLKRSAVSEKLYLSSDKTVQKKRNSFTDLDKSTTTLLVHDDVASKSSVSYYSDNNSSCSRVTPYEGRKYDDGHYKNTNDKIKEMEKNDTTLHKKMMRILQIETDKNKILPKEIEENSNLTKDQQKLNTMTEEFKKNAQANPINKSIESKESTKKDISIVEHNSNSKLTDFLDNINEIPSNSKSTNMVLPAENKIVGWLESNYKLYKKRIDKGVIKTCLETPKTGKVALHAWDFILSRYKERKNLFLISKQKPYRIFLSINTKDPFFESCININEIRFADLHKYPQTVKDLLINATDRKDNFCILRGLAQCWEIVGSVTKVSKNDDSTETDNEICDLESNPVLNSSDMSDDQSSTDVSEPIDNETLNLKQIETALKCSDEADSSKWFIMILENDFSEIRFYKKGFFVSYESIVKAINVARLSAKTVRLSTQTCGDENNGPRFGLYAIPNTSEYCVFIGPYEMQDSLGIETVKSIFDVRKLQKTRGFWMYTNKVDNIRVIDNPMSFMPSANLNFENSEALPLENHLFADKNLNDEGNKYSPENTTESQTKSLLKPKTKKIVKPIKIRKTNGFYHLATDGLLKKITLQNKSIVGAAVLPHLTGPNITKSLMLERLPNNILPNIENVKSPPSEDIVEGPQIKISAVYSQKEEPNLNTKKVEGNMFILKPEEINRMFDKHCVEEVSALESDQDISDSAVIECPLFQDSETSATITRCTVDEDICVISDEEDDSVREAEVDGRWNDVLIKCKNINDLGWIWGRRLLEKPERLSIRIPGGGQYTNFYGEKEAFEVLNRKLSQILGPTKPFNLDWQVVDLIEEFEGNLNPLNVEHLREAIIASGQSLKSPETLINVTKNAMRTYSRKAVSSTSSSPVPETS